MCKFFIDTEFIEDGKTIDLISIGIVAEDGREFYAISTEFDADKASDWVKKNVIVHLPEAKISSGGSTYEKPYMCRSEIAKSILEFVGDDKPMFWGYYSAYDWVALCQLYGTMMDLPKCWPMFCRDIKQLSEYKGGIKIPQQTDTKHDALNDARWNKFAWEFLNKVSEL